MTNRSIPRELAPIQRPATAMASMVESHPGMISDRKGRTKNDAVAQELDRKGAFMAIGERNQAYICCAPALNDAHPQSCAGTVKLTSRECRPFAGGRADFERDAGKPVFSLRLSRRLVAPQSEESVREQILVAR